MYKFLRQRTLAFLSLLILPSVLFAQGITDHLNNAVFNVINSKCSFDFATSYVGATFSFFYDSSEYVFPEEGTAHVTHANAFVLGLSLGDLNTDLNNFFTESNQPTFTVSFGHSFNSVTNFNNWDVLGTADRHFLGSVDHDLYVGVFASKGFCRYWDTVNNKMTDHTLANGFALDDFDKFFSYGLKASCNLYYTRWVALALSATVQNGYVLPLSSFQNAPAAYNATNNVYALSDLAGRVGGDINTRRNDLRYSVGAPVFIRAIYRSAHYTDRKDKEIANSGNSATKTIRRLWGSLFVTPFVVTDGWFDSRWNNEVGVSFNFTQSPYGGSNSKIAATEGLGIDWQNGKYTRNGWSGPIFYVTGKLNFGGSPNSGKQKMRSRDKKADKPENPTHQSEPDEDK